MSTNFSRFFLCLARGVVIVAVGLTASMCGMLSIGVSSVHAETHITDGFLLEDTVWNASGSPYLIGADVSVPYGRSLTIGPGVVVTSDPDLGWEPNIYANGPVIMNGDPKAEISISGLYGLTIDHSTTTIRYARLSVSDGLSFISSYGSISSSTITGAKRGIHSILSNINITASYIKGNDYGVVVEPVAPIFQVRRDSKQKYLADDDDTSSYGTGSNGTGGVGNALEDIPMVVISYSSLVENRYATIKNTDTGIVQATQNWWGSKDGPATSTVASLLDPGSSSVSKVAGNVNYIPWLDHDPLEEATSTPCCSNILFLPGIEGTWLYHDEGGLLGYGTSTNTLWAPNRNDDVRALFLDKNGSSTDKTIYSGAPIDNVFNLYHVYSSFERFLDGLVKVGTINDWKSFGYDWRKPIAEVVAGFEKKATTTESLMDTVSTLATRSRTGKVTLVAHSNGGLVAEYLVKTLAEQGLSGLIDSVISVAVPYLGTPTAISSILHGEHQSIAGGLILNASVARQLGQNMSSAYSLLPSSAYYSKVTTPTITFSSTTVSGVNDVSYPQVIHTSLDQNAFIDDVAQIRQASSSLALTNDDTSFPIVGNSLLMKAAESLHSILDTFSWPPNINRWNMLGWNNETPRALSYSSKQKCSSFFGFDITCSNSLVHTEYTTQMGDGTVVAPSAAYDSSGINGPTKGVNVTSGVNLAKVISLDLTRESNDAGEGISHANILESSSTQAVIKSIILHRSSDSQSGVGSASGGLDFGVLPAVSLGEPDYSQEPVRLVMTLEGDAELGVTDVQNHHTGIIPMPFSVTTSTSTGVADNVLSAYEEKIPGSHFTLSSESGTQSSGSVSRVTVPDSGQSYTVVISGNSFGSVNLSMDRIRGDQNFGHVEYTDIPMSPLSIATTTILVTPIYLTSSVPPTLSTSLAYSTLLASSTDPLQVDFDGDGTVDYVATSTLANSAISTSTITASTSTISSIPDIISRLKLLKKIIQTMSKSNVRSKALVDLVEKLSDLVKKGKLRYKFIGNKNHTEKFSHFGHVKLNKLIQRDQDRLLDQIEKALSDFE